LAVQVDFSLEYFFESIVIDNMHDSHKFVGQNCN